MVLCRKKKAKFIIATLSILLSAALILNTASAYVLQGGKLSRGVVNQTYYVGIDNQTISAQCVQAFADWNYAVQNTPETSNLGFSFTRSTSILGTTIRCWAENHPNEQWIGHAFYYTLDSNLNATPVQSYQNRDYGDCILNLSYYDWTYTYVTQLDWKVTAAHEIGHILGLAHNESDNGTLMYPYAAYTTATAPTRDEALGIGAKYS